MIFSVFLLLKVIRKERLNKEAVQELVKELKGNDGWVNRANKKLEKLLDLKDEDVH